ncbi:AAA family ATPase [Clavibacter sepedonicus]|uniref:Partitioning protein ParA n=1 Tax=Clavibacter sepedonicus TaxID=31964 RepID=B0RJF1_CLASE|nr:MULTISPECIES: ParA family protein [Clavibacter]MBD5382470.1 ParA family protein [Clavibacter sp.]OQJ45283.1 chromosome partitioning protein ParA [Clavibacter sepedonicus]OQJ50970.1 chromosome partitioning protein ParA [Clavibacter sepedonicus]UUK67222.1 ParA family protein [Clavibacter sepedonicus]CAQ03341.1 putative partitioning protein ParA [Clavibacter sepedonicus]
MTSPVSTTPPDVRPLDAPLRLTVGCLKGGVGRSTTSVELALALQRRTGQQVTLIDADSTNGTTLDWSELAGEEWPASITVVYWASQHLAKRVKDYNPTSHLIIDTGPHDPVILRQALAVTDHLIVPVGPTPGDISRMQSTIDAAAEVGVMRPHLELSVLITRTRENTISLRTSREGLKAQGMRVFDTHVPFKELYSQAMGTVPRDLGVYPAVLEEIIAGPSADDDTTHDAAATEPVDTEDEK